MKLKKLFVPGIWFNPNGPLARQLESLSFIILPILGVKTLKERVAILVQYLDVNLDVTTVVGHSAGCTVVLEAMKILAKGRITQLVLLNPASPKGTWFIPGIDPVFRLMLKPKYAIPMFWTGKDFALEPEDFKNVLSLSQSQLDDAMKNLVPDSGRFTAEMSKMSWKWPETYQILPAAHTIVVESHNDSMQGSFGPSLYGRLASDRKIELLTMGYGHLGTLLKVEDTLDAIMHFGFKF